MKQTLLSIAIALAAFLGFNIEAGAQTTKTYTDDLIVTINGESTEPQSTTVSVEFLENGNINFLLKNFNLMGEINVGTIEINDIQVVHGRRFGSFLYKDDINILPGDVEGVAESEYLGPMISPIPLKLKGKVSDDKLFVTIDIDMTSTLGQVIYVTFGTDFPALEVTSTKQYTDDLVVTINGESTEPMPTTVTVETLETGDINFVLKNFNLMGEINVGNIVVEELMLEGNKQKTFSFDGNLDITAGDVEGVEEEAYLGPMISPIPLKLNGKITDEKLYVTIDIDMQAMLGQTIHVTFGTEFPSTYALTFVIDGETINTQELEEGAAISAPEPEAREGYTFAWADAIPETMPAADLTINGAYTKNTYAVAFIVDGEEFAKYELEYGSDITAPQMEEREGYTFAWTDEIPATVPASNVEIKGAYTPNKYTVTWMLNGEVYTEMSIPFGEAIPDVEVKSDERYTFAGWEYVPETMPAQDVIIVGSLVDGINSVNGSSLKGQNAYNLAGQRVNANNARGIVVVNGKKILK